MKLIVKTVIIIITKDAGNGTKKEIVSAIPKYTNIHFRLFDRNCLLLVFISLIAPLEVKQYTTLSQDEMLPTQTRIPRQKVID